MKRLCIAFTMLGLVMLACGASVSGAGIQTAIAQTAAVSDSIEVQPAGRGDEPKVVPTMTALPTPEPTEETATEPPPPVFVTYRDFEILPAALTVQVGQQLEFLIESAAGQLHQPYTPGFQNPGPNDFEAPGKRPRLFRCPQSGSFPGTHRSRGH